MFLRLHPWAPLVTLTLLITGCTAPPPSTTPSPEGPQPPPTSHVLFGTVEPEGLAAPTFHLLGALVKGSGPACCFGEPSIWAHLDGSLLVTFPGCDQAEPFVGGPGSCKHGPVHRSTDHGATWKRLNRDGDGALTAEGPAANGDADVTVDAAGTIYASHLRFPVGAEVFKSTDNGTTWHYVGNAAQGDGEVDRQWMAAGLPGHLIVSWRGVAESRSVGLAVTQDGGGNWTRPPHLGHGVRVTGSPQWDPSGTRAFLPFVQGDDHALSLGRSLDGGLTWDVKETGVHIAAAEGNWPGSLIFPQLDVTGDEHVAIVWSEQILAPGDITSLGSRVQLVATSDWGETWTPPVDVSPRHPVTGLPRQVVMPWVTGGAGDRVAVTYYAADLPFETNCAQLTWDVVATIVDGVGSPTPRLVSSVVDANVHLGTIRTTGCPFGVSDRTLLDFFESDLLPDGHLAITYAADPVTGAKAPEIRVALQNGGTPLLERRASIG